MVERRAHRLGGENERDFMTDGNVNEVATSRTAEDQPSSGAASGSANCVNKDCRNYRVKLAACKYGYDVNETCETRNDVSERKRKRTKRPPGEPRWPNVKGQA